MVREKNISSKLVVFADWGTAATYGDNYLVVKVIPPAATAPQPGPSLTLLERIKSIFFKKVYAQQESGPVNLTI